MLSTHSTKYYYTGFTLRPPLFRAGDGITEIRSGTYIYNDPRTLTMFACTPDSLAATALATIVSVAGVPLIR